MKTKAEGRNWVKESEPRVSDVGAPGARQKEDSTSRGWEMLGRRKMKSLKFMGKEGAVDLTAHTHTPCS